MLIKGIFTNVSGSVGGVTGSRNKAGQYLRARTSPVNPNTSAQQTARSRLTNANVSWSGLTQTQREAWNEFATAQAWTNALGDAIQLSGQQAYVGSHTTLAASGLTPVTTPPPPNTRPAALVFSVITPDIPNGEMPDMPTGTLTAADRYLISASAFLPPGVSRFKGPFRAITSVAGNIASGPFGEQIFSAYQSTIQPITVGTRFAIRAVSVLATGQYSNEAIVITQPASAD